MKKRIIFHIDVNNAFLSWSAIDLLNKGYFTDIRNNYAVIGGEEKERRGVVLAKSILAKKKGIITGESIYNARKKYKDIRIFKPNHLFYNEMSEKLFNYLLNYTSDIEQFSIDECFLDYTPISHIYGDPINFAYKLKNDINKDLGFTVNIGIGNNKLCAKMASDFEKPNKVHTLFDEEIKTKMWSLDVNCLFGIGKQTSLKLYDLNIKTIGDLAQYDDDKLNFVFKKQGCILKKLANGINESEVVSMKEDNKCISNSTTLAKNITNTVEAYPILLSLVDNVCLTLRKQNKYANTVSVQIKDKYFHTYSKQNKLKNSTNITDEVYNCVINLFDKVWDGKPIRLLGVRLGDLTDISSHQISLFDEFIKREEDKKLQNTIDKLKDKYGNKIITRAVLKEKE